MHSLDDEELRPSKGKQLLSQQIADQLRTQVTGGEYLPGDRLPSENALMAQHGVSRTTARAALAILRHEGLVEARRGAGVFVRPAESLAIPVSDPQAAAAILRGRLNGETLTALIAALRSQGAS